MPPPAKSQPKAAVADKPLAKKVEAVAAAPVAAAPVVAQKGGKKAPKVEAAAPVVAAPVAVKGKKAAAPAPVVAAPVAVKGKKVAAPKVAKVAKTPKAKKEVVAAADDAEDADDAKGVRSFKVQLPGTEDYSGRFTGLTPYQAANKALSKYFRENKTAKAEITFSIRESTRGSKRSTYTYNGKREKLQIPVKYSIKSADGVPREIVKEYKNRLIKVKKADTKELVA
jgi:hypothetical protein